MTMKECQPPDLKDCFPGREPGDIFTEGRVHEPQDAPVVESAIRLAAGDEIAARFLSAAKDRRVTPAKLLQIALQDFLTEELARPGSERDEEVNACPEEGQPMVVEAELASYKRARQKEGKCE